MIPKTLGKYKIRGWIGGGAFGDVFMAYDTLSKRNYALKVSRMRERDSEMLLREAQMLASLDHPNIVRFYTADIIDGKLVLVMEYVEGKSLRELIQEMTSLDPGEAKPIVVDVLRALEYAHARGVLHRDIKPENILIEDSGRVKLGDFGLAQFFSGERMSVSVAGTPLYMAPEVWRGHYRKESDLYAVAAVLYEMLAGYPPFASGTFEGLRNKVMRSKPKRIPGVPAAIHTVLQRALSKDPRERYRDAGELISALLKAVGGKQLVIPTKGRRRRVSPALRGLTDEQRSAVLEGDGVFLLLGGAGTGKTTVLAHRIAYLIREKKVPPENVLAVTFTRKAAQDLKDKLARILTDMELKSLWAGTLHTLGLRILAKGGDRLGFSEEILILGPNDQLKVLNSVLTRTDRKKAKGILKEIGVAKSKLILPEELKERGTAWQRYVAAQYEAYQNALIELGAADYDDLIYYACRLLRENDDLLETFSRKFQHVLVDEFQDINRAQFELLRSLSSAHGNLFVTGDDDQAIYAFRGASFEFLRALRDFYPDSKETRLTLNFRAPSQVLQVALNLISHNRDRIPKVLVSRAGETEIGSVLLYAAKSDKDEAEFVTDKITELLAEGRVLEEMAVLYRINARSRPFEEALGRNGIPYNVLGSGRFFGREEVRAPLGYLRFLLGLGDREDLALLLKRILRFDPPEIQLALGGFHRKRKPTFSRKLEKKLDALRNLWTMVEDRADEVPVRTPADLLEELFEETGYMKWLRSRESERKVAERENVGELLGLAGEFGKGETHAFLNHAALSDELELHGRGEGGVRLITVHSAKGLEFPVVFLVGMVEGTFPMNRSLSTEEELEEERRLCYVALTRAQERLFVTYPKMRWSYAQEPSRFLLEMYSPPVR
jgi:DNA helicase-2/ATP-dependent DNA helicase PcrA